MPHLAIHLLGPPRVEVDGRPIEVDTRKAVALLAYLAVTDRPQSRDVLAALLWEEYDQSRARAALRRTLSALKGALQGGWLELSRDVASLAHVPDVEIDVRQFEDDLERVHAHADAGAPCTTCMDLLEAAAALYRDHFMAGFCVRDSEPFEEWQIQKAGELERSLGEALDRLTEGYRAQRDLEAAIHTARRRLLLDPLHEPAHALLMRLYHESGRRSDALRQYRECVAVLDQELAVAPLEETTRLYQAIRENQEPAQAHPRGDTSSPSRPSALFVGRESELATLEHAYAAPREGGHVILLEGEAGIGKSRLAEEALQRIRADGGRALVIRCYEGESNLAYAPFVGALREAVRTLESTGRLSSLSPATLSEVSRILPELSGLRPDLPTLPPLDNPGAQSRFVEAIGEMLVADVQGPRPGVLVVEDVQWADHASIDLLAALIRRLRDTSLCLLVTWRSEQMPAGHWLRRRITEMQGAGEATVLRLERLDRASILRLVRSAIQRDGDERLAELGTRLYQETEGLPLFLHAYVAALDTDSPSQAWSLPGTVRDLLHSRLAGTSEMGWQVLSTGAVIGRSFDFETVRAASGRDEEMVVAGLEELMSAGLITELEEGSSGLTYDFNHEKLRTLVYDETSLARRRLLHRRVAETLSLRARGRDAAAGQIAAHYRLAGDEHAAAEYYLRAGVYARSLYANREALQHFETALAFGHPDGSVLHEEIGDVQTLLGDYAQAERSYETAVSLSVGAQLGRIEHKLGLVYQRQGEWDMAESLLEEALGSLGGEGLLAERARVLADRSLVAHQRGDADRARSLAEDALSLAEKAEDLEALAQVHNLLGILASARGDRAQARVHLERSLTFAGRLESPAARAAASNNLALVAREDGDWQRARELSESALALAIAQGDRHRVAALHNNLADLLHVCGESAEAVAHVKAAVTIYSEIGVEAGAVRPEIWKLTEW